MKTINFKQKMIDAIRNQQKTVTRRVIKPQPEKFNYNSSEQIETFSRFYIDENGDYLFPKEGTLGQKIVPKYYVGDILHVQSPDSPSAYNNLFIKVTDIHPERLHDIDKREYFAQEYCNEGLSIMCTSCHHFDGSCRKLMASDICNLKSSFMNLWDSTIIPDELNLYGWDSNPWVWVITFELIQK